MKNYLIYILLLFCLVVRCKSEDDAYLIPLKKINACGVDDPLNKLQWLNDLANKSLTDKTGNYQGNIWIKNYQDKSIIITDFQLGSGGVAFHVFNCDGSEIIITDIDFFNSLTDEYKIFTTIKQKL